MPENSFFIHPADSGKTEEELFIDRLLLAREYAKMHSEAYAIYGGEAIPRFKGPVHVAFMEEMDKLKTKIEILNYYFEWIRQENLKAFNDKIAELKKKREGMNNDTISRSESSTESIPTGICESVLCQESGEAARS